MKGMRNKMKKPTVIVITGPTASRKKQFSSRGCKKDKRRNYISRFHANISRYEYWNS